MASCIQTAHSQGSSSVFGESHDIVLTETIINTKRKSHGNYTTQPRKRIRSITSSLPQRLAGPDRTSMTPCPRDIVKTCFEKNGLPYSLLESSTMKHFFIEMTEENVEAYEEKVISAIRTRDVASLKSMKKDGRMLQCCNRFGESLIHMACRRGFTEIVSFLITEGNVSLRVRDDYGRTPMHDACWVPTPNFELMKLLIEAEPGLLLLSDKRGHTPMDYTRREHWDEWARFLMENLGKENLDKVKDVVLLPDN